MIDYSVVAAALASVTPYRWRCSTRVESWMGLVVLVLSCQCAGDGVLYATERRVGFSLQLSVGLEALEGSDSEWCWSNSAN